MLEELPKGVVPHPRESAWGLLDPKEPLPKDWQWGDAFGTWLNTPLTNARYTWVVVRPRPRPKTERVHAYDALLKGRQATHKTGGTFKVKRIGRWCGGIAVMSEPGDNGTSFVQPVDPANETVEVLIDE